MSLRQGPTRKGNENPDGSVVVRRLEGIKLEKNEELQKSRFLIIINMLKEFPELKRKVKKWLEENPNN